METKQQLTIKFVAGVVLIIVSLVLGKLVLVPILLFPGSTGWRTSMIIMYAFSWLLLLAGLVLAGVEGFRLATHKYREYKRRTVHKMKSTGRNAAHKTKRAAKKTVHVLKNSHRVMRKRPRM